MLIDAHTHIFPPEVIANRIYFFKNEPEFTLIYANPKSPMATYSDLIETMKKSKIDICWVLGFPWMLLENARRHNNYLAQAVNKSNGRLRGLACIHPSASWSLKEAERSFNLGLHGLGELAYYTSDLNLNSLTSLCKLCAEVNRPLLLHTNEPIGYYYPGKAPITLNKLYTLIKKNQRTKLILAHMAGGLFFYTLLKKEVPSFFNNVWIDTAAVPLLYQTKIYRIASEILGAKKILLGTDYPLLKIEKYLQDLTSIENNLNAKKLEFILSNSAKQLIP